jgi:hypothetical protein
MVFGFYPFASAFVVLSQHSSFRSSQHIYIYSTVYTYALNYVCICTHTRTHIHIHSAVHSMCLRCVQCGVRPRRLQLTAGRVVWRFIYIYVCIPHVPKSMSMSFVSFISIRPFSRVLDLNESSGRRILNLEYMDSAAKIDSLVPLAFAPLGAASSHVATPPPQGGSECAQGPPQSLSPPCLPYFKILKLKMLRRLAVGCGPSSK